MAKKNIADKYWIYGEDAELAARLTSYLTRVVYNQRANYIRALMRIKEHECSIEDCDSDIESQSICLIFPTLFLSMKFPKHYRGR